MTCAYATWDGSYVLGALAPAEREEFERHLVDCRSCAEAVRGLAGLPGLLSRVDEQAVATPPERAPDTLLPRLVREVRRERRRRARAVSGVAAAAVVTVVAGAATIGALNGSEPPAAGPPGTDVPSTTTSPGPSGPATPVADARAMEPVGGAPVEGWLTLETVPWGTRLTLLCTYGPTPGGYGGVEPAGYVMVVRTRDGGEREVATWNAVPGRAMQVAAATASGRADIASVEVRTDTGRPVLRLRG